MIVWVPYADGVWFNPVALTSSGGFSLVLKGLPARWWELTYHVSLFLAAYDAGSLALLGTTGLQNRERNLEPAGEAHTLVITEDSGPMMAFFVVEGDHLFR
jgi:hypothetical protein